MICKMEKYDTILYGRQIQSIRQDIFSISWSEGYDAKPRFFFFPSLDDIVNYIKDDYDGTFVLDRGTNTHRYGITPLVFDDSVLIVKLLTSLTGGDTFQFYNSDLYQNLKVKLITLTK